MSNTYLSEGNQIVFKEKFKDILMDFIADYDENKWSNDDIYEKYSNKLLEEFNITVADLEAKLAESKEICISLEGLRKSEAEKKDIAMKRVAELKQQLAEKEKEYNQLEILHYKDIEAIESCSKEIYKTKYRNGILESQHQDKISFCIEKLEKVLNFVDGRTYLAQYIKEQIEELKKEIK